MPARKPPGIVPFWKGEALERPFHYAERIARFLEEAQVKFYGSDGALLRVAQLSEAPSKPLGRPRTTARVAAA
jgi:Lhr-like helicase